MRFVYSRSYIADIGIHVFPIEKYRLVGQALAAAGIPEALFVEPEAATSEQLMRVHTPDYLDDLAHCRRTHRTQFSELPISSQIVRMFTLASGGTILASELALEERAAVHIGGGFHHAFADKAEGFCYLNDLAVAIRHVQAQGKVRKAMVIDCDLHQGNGTARIFQDDANVFTFSMHQGELYPVKEVSDFDIHLDRNTRDDEYLRLMRTHIPRLIDSFGPDFILYQAGADPFEDDQLGDLKLTIEGLFERDRLVFQWAKERNIPIAATLGGGYARNVKDTVTIHTNTGLAGLAVYERS